MGSNRRWTRTLLCVFVVTPIVAAIIPATVDPRPECEQAQSWVAARANRLPTTLDDVAAFPTVYRHAIFSTLSAEAKAGLWQERLARLARGPLSPAQRALVDEARALVTPEIYRTRRVPQDWVVRATRELGREGFKRTFKELAEGEGSYRTLGSSLVQLTRRWNDFATTSARPECDCAYHTNDCGPSEVCCPLLCTFSYGCGPFGTYSCDSVCRLTCPY